MITFLSPGDAEAAGPRERRVLLEQRPDHYPEFGRFLRAELARAGGALWFRGASGAVYGLRAVSPRAAPDGLGGVEIVTRLSDNASAPLDETIDADLWPLFEWLVAAVGGEWTLDALRQTGAIYRLPGAPDRA